MNQSNNMPVGHTEPTSLRDEAARIADSLDEICYLLTLLVYSEEDDDECDGDCEHCGYYDGRPVYLKHMENSRRFR